MKARFWKGSGIVCASLLVAVLCALFLPTPARSANRDFPTLFHNDEVWYKDNIAPALIRDGVVHVPSDIFAMFDYITLKTEGENLLFVNTQTGDYVSILYSARAACVNGHIVEGIRVFRADGYYYMDAAFLTAPLGLFLETSEKGEVRIYDADCVMSFDELLSMYEEAEEAKTETEPEVEPDDGADYSPTQIFLCCLGTAETDAVFARQLADRYGYGYTLFLTPDTEEEEFLSTVRSAGFGEIGLSVTGEGDSAVKEADALNERIAQCEEGWRRREKSHLVLSVGEEGEESAEAALRKAGYYVFTPDFVVTQGTDAKKMFEEIVRLAASEEKVTVLLGDVWQTETLLLYLDTLDTSYYSIGPLN